MKKLYLIISFLVFFVCQCAAPSKFPYIIPEIKAQKKDMRDLAVEFFILGNRYYYQNHKELALKAYQKAVECDPKNASLRRIVVPRALEQGKADVALDIIKPLLSGKTTPSEWRLLGEIYIQKKMFDKAGRAFKKALSFNPDDSRAHFALGLIYQAQGKLKNSVEELRAAKRLEEGPLAADERAALMYMKTKILDSSEVILNRLVKKKPDEIRYRRSLAAVYEANGRDSAASELYTEILKKNPEDDLSLSSLGNLFLRQGKWSKSMSCFRKLYKKHPENLSYLKTLAVLYFETEKYDSAETLFTIAAGRSEDDPETHYYLGLIYLEQASLITEKTNNNTLKDGKFDLALIEFNKAIALRKDFMEAWIQLGVTYLRIDDTKSAIRIYTQAKDLMPDKPQIYYLLGISYQANKEQDKAIKAFLNTLKLDPKNKKTLFELGTAYERSGRFEKAVNTFSKLIEIDSLDAMALNYLGYMWAEKGINLDKAEKYIKKALEIKPDNAAFLDSYGWVLFKQGHFEEAKKYILKAIKLMKKLDPVLLDHLGDIYKSLNNPEGARKSWTKALELKPDDKEIRKKLNSAAN